MNLSQYYIPFVPNNPPLLLQQMDLKIKFLHCSKMAGSRITLIHTNLNEEE